MQNFIMIGIFISLGIVLRRFKVLGIKLLAAPLAVLTVCRLVDMKGLAVGVSILEAGMPPMVTAGALAAVAGMEAELAIALVGIGILCSFGSLPVLHWLVTL